MRRRHPGHVAGAVGRRGVRAHRRAGLTRNPGCHVCPFDTEDEAIHLANDTPYGLAATVWTRDVARTFRMGSSLNTGIVWINSWFLRDLRTPFGGSKQSGIGREGGVHSLEFYTELRNVCVST